MAILTRTQRIHLIAKKYGISAGTLYRWIATRDRGGLEMLAPQNGAGHRGRMKLDEQVRAFIQAQYLSPSQLKISTVQARAKEFALSNDLPTPSYAQTRRCVQALPNAVVLYHRLGSEEWRHRAMPKAVRDLNATTPGEWYVGDHREFDIFVKVRAAGTVDRREGGWRIFRLWLSAWQDIGSRDLVGWHIGEAPNSTTIACAARQAIMTFGRPGHWYYDNGKDYRSHYLSGKTRAHGKIPLTDDAVGIFRLIGSEIHFAKPYSPWAKPIERFFGYIKEWEKTLPGWCGKDNKERPEKLEAEIKAGELLTLDEFIAKFSEWVQTYRNTIHGELSATPASKWEGVTREIPDARALDLLLMEKRQVKVYTTGIHIYGRYFWADELSAFVGDSLTVRFDRNEVGRVYVYRGYKFLCEAVNKPLLRMGASREDLQAEARRKARARKIVQQTPQMLAEIHSQGLALNAVIRERAAEIREEERAPKAAKRAGGQPGGRQEPAAAIPSGPVVPLMTKFDGMAKEIEKRKRRQPAIPLEPAPTPEPQEDAAWLAQVKREREYQQVREWILGEMWQLECSLNPEERTGMEMQRWKARLRSVEARNLCGEAMTAEDMTGARWWKEAQNERRSIAEGY